MSDLGYLSDVPTHNSNAASEISQDLITSTKALENHFKFKYQSLRNAYEQRIKQFSDFMEKLQQRVFSDEILLQMKQDTTSSLFTAAHLQEMVQIHLSDEKEHYLRETLEKNFVLSEELSQLKKNYIALEEELKKKIDSVQQKNSILKQSLKEKVDEANLLHLQVQEQKLQLQQYEQSMENSALQLALLEESDHREGQMVIAMKDQLESLKEERNRLQQKLARLQGDYDTLSNKFTYLQTSYEKKKDGEEASKKKLSSLMFQVESLVEEEINQSNQAITQANEKMKAIRFRLMTELKREKRLTTSLQEELVELRSLQGETSRENLRLTRENQSHRELLLETQSQVANLQEELTAIKEKCRELQRYCGELESSKSRLSEQYEQQSLHFQEKLQEMTQKTIKETQEAVEAEHRLLDQKARIERLSFENGQVEIREKLRQSYSFDPAPTNPSMSYSGDVSNQFHSLQDELSFRQMIQTLRQEKQLLKEQLISQEEVLRRRWEVAERERLQAMQEDCQQQVSNTKEMLSEASAHIGKLMTMLKEEKRVIRLQQHRIEQLQNNNLHLHQELNLFKQQQQSAVSNNRSANTTFLEGDLLLRPPKRSKSPLSANKSDRTAQLYAAAKEKRLLEESNRSKSRLSQTASSNPPVENEEIRASQENSSTDQLSHSDNNMEHILLLNQTIAEPVLPVDSALRDSERQLEDTSKAFAQAQEEIRQGKLLNHQLQIEKSDLLHEISLLKESVLQLQTKLEEASSSNNGNTNDNSSSRKEYLSQAVQTIPSPPTATISEGREANNETGILLSHIDPSLATGGSFFSSSSFCLPSPTQEPQKTQIQQRVSIGVNTLPQSEVLELQTANQRLMSANHSLEERLGLEEEQRERLSKEVQELRREKTVQAGSLWQLKQTCTQIYQLYRYAGQQMKWELSQVKQEMLQFLRQFSVHENHSTTSAIVLQLQVLLRATQLRIEQQHKQTQQRILQISQEERKALEQSYLVKIEQLQASHEKELVKISYELAKQRVAEHTMTTTESAIPRVELLSPPAFESSLQGVLQAMIDQSIISRDLQEQVFSIAREHHEPSCATSTAIRSLIGEEIDKFILELLNKKYPSTSSSSIILLEEEKALSL